MFVNGAQITGVKCHSGDECDSSSTYSCLSEYDIAALVSSGASEVTVTLAGSDQAEYCTPSLAATLELKIRAGPTPQPTASPRPTVTPLPSTTPTTEPSAELSIFTLTRNVSCTMDDDYTGCDASFTFDISSYTWSALLLSVNDMYGDLDSGR